SKTLKHTLPIILTLLLFSAAASAQSAVDPANDGVPEIILARGDSLGKMGQPTTEFLPTDIPIYCIVQLDSSEPVTVKMNLVAVNVPGVRPESKVVSTTYTTKDMQNRVDFTGRPAGLWVAGRYRVDVFLNDKPAGSKEFIVDKAAKDANSVPRQAVTPRPSPVIKPVKSTRRASMRS
ncbi:MAG TPA: hypothetical protein VHL50_04810, partial [Pyrinomonadaceae bacterium]|nr:hypothetical protein [Pyrinomonadaceae bacterium]